MIRNLFIICLLGAGLMACSSYNTIKVENEQIKVDNSVQNNTIIDSLILPYRKDLEKEMNEVLAIAEIDFLVQRPCGNLNNWVADALLDYQVKKIKLDAPVFCLLNTGGIRSSINKGNVTRGDLFKVMPFDNFIVYVKMPVSSLTEIEKYLISSGGEPISGARLEKGKLILDEVDKSKDYIWIITSDYLVNGGDKMTFFKQNIEIVSSDVLLRDILLLTAKEQTILKSDSISRITF